MNRLTLLALLLAAGAPLPMFAAQDSEPTAPKAPEPAKETRRTLAIHKTDARFTGLVKQPCRHLTSECPDRCDHGGVYAEFKILAYRHHEITGKYGSERTGTFRVRLRNSRGEGKLDAALLGKIEALKPGDGVRLEWRHDYVTRAGASFPEHPVTLLEPAGTAGVQPAECAEAKDA